MSDTTTAADSFQEIYALTYDFEATGAPTECRSIALGMSVVDSQFKELDSLLVPFYKPNEALFEWRCVNEFWLGPELKELQARRDYDAMVLEHPEAIPPPELLYRVGANPPSAILSKLEAMTTQRTQEEAERDATNAFVEFVQRWDKRAKADGAVLMRCSDNAVCDTQRINTLLGKYRPDLLQLPHTLNEKNDYTTHYDVHQIQVGFLSSIDGPEWLTRYWGCSKRMDELFVLPAKAKGHTHSPDEDAYSIAYDLQVVINAARGKLERRK